MVQARRPSETALNGWVWLNQVFNWWAFLAALLLFLPIGFLAGYNVRQPSLAMPSVSAAIEEVRAARAFLLRAEIPQPRDVQAKVEVLESRAQALRDASRLLPEASRVALERRIGAVTDASSDIEKTLRQQNIAYDRALNDNLLKIDGIYERLRRQTEASADLPSIIYDQLKRFMKWIGAVSFLTLLAASLFLLSLSNPSIRARIAKSGSISAFGVTLNFSDLQSVRASIQVRQNEIEEDVKSTYRRVLRNSRLGRLFIQAMDDMVRRFAAIGVDLSKINYRATLFVPGFVGQELVQATGYYGNWKMGNDLVIGRRFSVRYGIIGKCWRLQTCQYNPQVQNIDKNLVRNWGFTREEAQAFEAEAAVPASGSLMAFVIGDIGDGPPLGVIYIEADGADQLHPEALRGRLSADRPLGDGTGMTSADRFAQDAIWSQVSPAVIHSLRGQLNRLQRLMRWNDKIQAAPGR